MELAILSCNNKLNNDTAFQIFAMYEYLKRQGNNVQVVDCGLKDYKKNYDFLSSNVVLTVNTYMDYRRFEENQPLVDKYIILNYDCDDENLNLNGKENIIYGINNISNKQIEKIANDGYKISSIVDLKNKNIKNVVDPVFLISKEQWLDEVNQKSKIDVGADYVLVYSDIVTKEMLKYAEDISRKNCLKMYVVADKIQAIFYKRKRIKNTNIIDLANLISNAQTIVTSCNDAIKLAVVFDKNLHIFDVQDDEQIELIDKLNLKKRIVKDTSRVLEPWQEYKDIKEKIEDLKTDSYELLQ